MSRLTAICHSKNFFMRFLNGSACTSAGASSSKNMDTDTAKIKERAKQLSDDLILQIEAAKKKGKISNVQIAKALDTSPQNIGEKLSTGKKRGASYFELASIICAIESISGKKFMLPKFCSADFPQSNVR